MQNRKLLNIELGRVSADEYKELPESGIVVGLSGVPIMWGLHSVLRTRSR